MALSEWALCEIEYDREGPTQRPVTRELSAHGKVGERARAIGCLRLLRLQGWPEARKSLLVDEPLEGIFVLKCKPSCWRLYFHVEQTQKMFLLLHAVCKKAQKRDPNDPKKAARRFADWQNREAKAGAVTL